MEEGDEYIIDKKEKGKISEFFNHLITYGGFGFDDGIMTVWGDTSLFVPLDAFVTYYHELKLQLGRQADDLFYWLGHLYGRNSSQLLIKKFGFDKKKVSDFVNGATQDGFGYMDLLHLEYKKNHLFAHIEGTNANFAKRYKELFGDPKTSVDWYMAGILGGGAEPLFNLPMKTVEKQCMGSGADKCIYDVNNITARMIYPFFDKTDMNSDDLIQKTERLGQKRKIKFQMFKKKEIKFGDGSFILRGFPGFNLATYEMVILDRIVKALLGEEKFATLKDKIAQTYIQGTVKEELKASMMSKKSLTDLIEHLKLFGYGHLSLYRFQKNTVIIKCENNPYLADQMSLFGKIEKDALDFFGRLLQYAFETYFGKKITASVNKLSFKESFVTLSISA